MTRVAGSLAKSGEVLKLVNNLMKVPQLQRTMMEMSKGEWAGMRLWGGLHARLDGAGWRFSLAAGNLGRARTCLSVCRLCRCPALLLCTPLHCLHCPLLQWSALPALPCCRLQR
jgi:hypothetical protein